MADDATFPQGDSSQSATDMAASRQQLITDTSGDVDTEELATKVYDMIMADIEPDLLSYNIELLDDYYAGESEQEHAERMQRYEYAYQEFDRQFESFMGEIEEEVRQNRRSALREKEEEARGEEAETLSALEAAFN